MKITSEIRNYGKCAVPSNWSQYVIKGINRIYYIHSGSGEYFDRGKRYGFESNMLYFFPYTVEVGVLSGSEDPIIHSYMDFEMVPPILCPQICKIDPESDAMLKAAAEVFLAGAQIMTEEHLSLDELKSRKELYSMCDSAAVFLAKKAAEQVSAVTVRDKTVISVMEEMLSRMSEPLTVESLAERYFISPDALIRKFKRSLGITPYAYLKQLRLRTARYMLDDGKTLTEAAEACGYSDSSSLLHSFKRATIPKTDKA